MGLLREPQSQIRRGITQTIKDMKFVWTQVALFICGAVVMVHSAPASTAMDSKRADASSYVRFGKRNPESSDDFLSNLLEAVTTRNRRAPESSYIRFGKRAPESSYIRFGKRARSLDLDALQDCLNEQMTRADYFQTIRPTYTDAVRICQEE